MVFEEEQKVEARTPGTRTYSEAEVVSYSKGTYLLKFGDEVHPVLEQYVRAPMMKTTTAARGRGRSKSPARLAKSRQSSYNIRGRSATRPAEVLEKPKHRSPGRPPKRLKSPKPAAKTVGNKRPGRKPAITSTANELSGDKPSFMQQMHDTESVLRARSPGRVKNVGIVSPTSSSQQKAWSESIKRSATIILHDILSSSSSRSVSRSSSRTNSELGAIDDAKNIGRDTPIWFESDFGNLENVEVSDLDNKHKSFSQGIRRSTHVLTQVSDTKSNIRQRGLTPVSETNIPETSDNEDILPNVVKVTSNNIIFKIIEYFSVFILVNAALLICVFLFYSCRAKLCGFRLPQTEYLLDSKTFFSACATLYYLSFYWAVVILSVVRVLGSNVYGFPSKDGILNYYFNGLFSTILIIVALFSLQWYEIPILKYIQEQHLKLLIASIICSLVTSITLFVKSYFIPVTALNPNGYTDSAVLDFWIGREVNPRILSIFDMKIIHYRTAIIGSIILSISIGYVDIQDLLQSFINDKSADYNITLITMVMLQLLFDLDLMMHEKQLIATLEIQHDGVGLMVLLKNGLYPFLKVFSLKYIAQQNVRVPALTLPAIVALFAVGYVLFRYSNNMKYKVRANPTDSRFQFREMYTTYSGRQLLVAKTWGFVRHPNYLGHILILLSYSVPLLWTAPMTLLPFIPTILGIAFLMHRALRCDRYLEQKHKSCWTRYKGVVRYRLFPRIF